MGRTPTRTITGTSQGDTVSMDNKLLEYVYNGVTIPEGLPSKAVGDVSLTLSDGVTFTHAANPVNEFYNINMGAGDDVFYAYHMPWAADTYAQSVVNGINVLDMGAGNDFAYLQRMGARTVNMGAGDDTLRIVHGYTRSVDMGAGDDSFIMGPESDITVTKDEFADKVAAAMMTINGGDGDNDVLKLYGEWTITLTWGSGNFMLDRDGTVDGLGDTVTVRTLSWDQFSLVYSMPADLKGTVSWGTLTVDGVTGTAGFSFTNFESIQIVCFTAGTPVSTPNGLVPIEQLTVGQVVNTTRGPMPVRWVGQRRVDVVDLAGNQRLLPVLIPKDALAPGVPARDIRFSQQHRVVVRSDIAKHMFGQEEVLATVKHLVGWNGITIDADVRDVTYVHILLDGHQTIMVDGIEAETLYPGPQAFEMLNPEARAELSSLFDNIEEILNGTHTPESVMPLLNGRDTKALKARHALDDLPLYSAP